MAQITADMIKELRERSGVGIGKCKEALEATQGSMDGAIEWLRKAGMASAVKKEGRATNEGQIGFAETDSAVAIVEVNAETDFVVNNDKFKNFVSSMATEAVKTKPSNLEGFLAQKSTQDPSMTIDEIRATLVQSIGENIQIRRVLIIEKKKDSSVGVYSHLGGKIVTVVEISGGSGQEELAKDIGMHIAASAPEYVRPEDVPADIVNKEKEIFASQVVGKPEFIVEKIVSGKINSFFNQICLNKQPYIRDDSVTIEELVARKGKNLSIVRFIRWSVGGQ